MGGRGCYRVPIDPGRRLPTWGCRKVGVGSPVCLAVRFGMDPADPYGLTPEQRTAIGLLTG